jgi:hypothetical protein
MNENDEKRRFRKLQLQSRLRKSRLDDFVKAAFTTQQGREYFYFLLEISGIGKNPFTANALTTSFSCGELNVGQQIQAHIIEVAPDGYLQMLKEREEERLNAERSSAADSAGTDDASAE